MNKKTPISLIITIVVIAISFTIGFTTNPDADKVEEVKASQSESRSVAEKKAKAKKEEQKHHFFLARIRTTEPPKIKKINKISDAARNKFYGESAFIGSSIGVGQEAYFKNKGSDFLGSPLMLVTGSYSFSNDRSSGSGYKLSYNGVPMMAKDAVKASKVPRVFIAMGTNDCFGGADYVFDEYKKYIEGIKKESPNVVIFIESTTGVTAAKQGTYLNSKTITGLNKLMEEYCKKQKDMYYIDVSSKMLDGNGYLKTEYSSDNYVHLSTSAYELWTNEMIAYTDKLMIKEYNAKSAVKVAVETGAESAIEESHKLVDALDNSTVKDNLNKQLKELEA
ncbi:MAG: hypothetical protein IJR60_01805 [Eubacterium sp.]|nr:hypothetical protein [Eubacterium sp.]